jgi:hypothetical protein
MDNGNTHSTDEFELQASELVVFGKVSPDETSKTEALYRILMSGQKRVGWRKGRAVRLNAPGRAVEKGCAPGLKRHIGGAVIALNAVGTIGLLKI